MGWEEGKEEENGRGGARQEGGSGFAAGAETQLKEPLTHLNLEDVNASFIFFR